MPTYEYECDGCGYAFEHLQSMTDKKLKKCPECGKMKLHRLIGSGSGIIFKGTGFYETDFKTKDEPKEQKASDSGSKSKASSSPKPKKKSTPAKSE